MSASTSDASTSNSSGSSTVVVSMANPDEVTNVIFRRISVATLSRGDVPRLSDIGLRSELQKKINENQVRRQQAGSYTSLRKPVDIKPGDAPRFGAPGTPIPLQDLQEGILAFLAARPTDYTSVQPRTVPPAAQTGPQMQRGNLRRTDNMRRLVRSSTSGIVPNPSSIVNIPEREFEYAEYPLSIGISNFTLATLPEPKNTSEAGRVAASIGKPTLDYLRFLLDKFIAYTCFRYCDLPFVVDFLKRIVIKGPLTDYQIFVLLSAVEETASDTFLSSVEWDGLSAIRNLISCVDLLENSNAKMSILSYDKAQRYFVDRIMNAEIILRLEYDDKDEDKDKESIIIANNKDKFWDTWINFLSGRARNMEKLLEGWETNTKPIFDRSSIPGEVQVHGGKSPSAAPHVGASSSRQPIVKSIRDTWVKDEGTVSKLNLNNKEISRYDTVITLVVKMWEKMGVRNMSDHLLLRPWNKVEWSSRPASLKTVYKHILPLKTAHVTDWKLYYYYDDNKSSNVQRQYYVTVSDVHFSTPQNPTGSKRNVPTKAQPPTPVSDSGSTVTLTSFNPAPKPARKGRK